MRYLFSCWVLIVSFPSCLMLLHGAAVRGSDAQQQQQQRQQLDALLFSPYVESSGRLEGAFFSLLDLFERPSAVFSPLAILSVLAIAGEGADGLIKEDLDKLVTNPVAYLPPAAYRGAISNLMEFLPFERPALDVFTRLYVLEEWVGREDLNIFKEEMRKKLNNPSAVRTMTQDTRHWVIPEINKDVAEITRGRIRKLLSSSQSERTRIILIAAAFFRSRFLSSFSKRKTRPGRFWPYAHSRVGQLAMYMNKVFDIGGSEGVYYYEAKDIKVVGIPYDYPGACLFIYFPRDIYEFQLEIANDPKLLTRLAEAARETAFDAPGTDIGIIHQLRLSLPIFDLPAEENEINVIDLLTYLKIGMPNKEKEFVKGSKPYGPLDLALFNHKAAFHIDERGTEVTTLSAEKKPVFTDEIYYDDDSDENHHHHKNIKGIKSIRFNKPFIFELRVKINEMAPSAADLIVYAGRIAGL